MRDLSRIDKILLTLKAVWEREPDLRLGQLVVNAIILSTGVEFLCSTVFYAEDDKIRQGLSAVLEPGKSM